MTFGESLGIASRAVRAFEKSMAAVRRLERMKPRALNGSVAARVESADAWGSGASSEVSLPLYARAAGTSLFGRLLAGASAHGKPYVGAKYAGGGVAARAAFRAFERAEAAARVSTLHDAGGSARSGASRLMSAFVEGIAPSGQPVMAYGGMRGALSGRDAVGAGVSRAASLVHAGLAGGVRYAPPMGGYPLDGMRGTVADARQGFAGMLNLALTASSAANRAAERAVSPGSALVGRGVSASGVGMSMRGVDDGRTPLTARLVAMGAGGLGTIAAGAGTGGVHTGVVRRGVPSRAGATHAQVHGAVTEGARTRAALERYRTMGLAAPFMGMGAARSVEMSARMTSSLADGGSARLAMHDGAVQGSSRTPEGTTALRRLSASAFAPGESATEAAIRRVARGARIGMGEAGGYLSPGELSAMLETASSGKGDYYLTIEGGGGASGFTPAASAAPASIDEDALAARLAERIRRESRMAASGVYGMSRR